MSVKINLFTQNVFGEKTHEYAIRVLKAIFHFLSHHNSDLEFICIICNCDLHGAKKI